MTQPRDRKLGNPFHGMSAQEAVAYRLEANAAFLMHVMAREAFPFSRGELASLAADMMQDAKALRRK